MAEIIPYELGPVNTGGRTLFIAFYNIVVTASLNLYSLDWVRYFFYTSNLLKLFNNSI